MFRGIALFLFKKKYRSTIRTSETVLIREVSLKRGYTA